MRSVLIDHAVYNIIFENTKDMNEKKGSDDEIAGQINQATRTIHISPDFPEEFQISTIWHEIIHGVWYSWGMEHHPENIVNLFASTVVGLVQENKNWNVLDGFSFRGLFYRVTHKKEEGTFVDIDNLHVHLGKVHADRKPHQLWTTLFYIALKEAGFENVEYHLPFYRTLGTQMPQLMKEPRNAWLVDATALLALPASPPIPPSTTQNAPEPLGKLGEISLPEGERLVAGSLFPFQQQSPRQPASE